ncbi:E3 ubiquitin/ISG15 ligase TRIM25-like [Protopterus annectens]|uniref:E3 ubiquitin/ISG15 ligase TRIM25-like n=1 Tax=Protopterus annectens TaxID=7888 RepID=UPI001CFC1A39|nr:E3 ubiquitin/ISG15 ligase TRIM25-like [Protopterus annectens]
MWTVTMQDGLLQTVLEEEMTCSICLLLYTEPVTLPCGHNFCSACIQTVWENTDKNRCYVCPECKAPYFSKPALQKDYKICSIVERFSQSIKNMGHSSIPCDICLDKASAAVKTCLKCELAMCEFHLQPHLQRPAFKSHALMEPIAEMHKWKCADHNEMLRFFCMDDKAYLCATCAAENLDHRTHNLRNFTTAQNEIKDQLRATCHELTAKEKEYDWLISQCHKILAETKEKFAETKPKVKLISAQLRKWIDEFEEDVEKYFQIAEDKALEDLRHHAAKLEGLNEQIRFTKEEIRIHCNGEKFAETKPKVKLISAQLRKWIDEFEEDVEKYFQIAEDKALEDLRHHAAKLEGLNEQIRFTKEEIREFIVNKQPGLQFLKAYESLQDRLPKDSDYSEECVPQTTMDYSHFHEETERAFTNLQKKCAQFKSILHHAFYGSELTLDQNTANPHLRLTDNFRTVRSAEYRWPYPSHPDRFDCCNQVLCSQTVDQGQHYWEIQTVGEEWAIGLAYTSIPRKTEIAECLLGQGVDSWCIEWSENQMFACHQSNSIPILGVENPSKICLFLDYEAGEITFYVKENTLRHLHSFSTNFTAPLSPGFCVIKGSLTLE